MYLPWPSYAPVLYFTEIASYIHSSEAGCILMYALVLIHSAVLDTSWGKFGMYTSFLEHNGTIAGPFNEYLEHFLSLMNIRPKFWKVERIKLVTIRVQLNGFFPLTKVTLTNI